MDYPLPPPTPMKDKDKIRKARQLMNNIQNAMKGYTQEHNKRIENIEKMFNQLNTLLQPGTQLELENSLEQMPTLPPDYAAVEHYLIETKKFKTYNDYDRWRCLKIEGGYAGLISHIHQKTGIMLTQEEITKIAKQCLTPNVQVIQDV